jgi:rod shape-determining protein MreD
VTLLAPGSRRGEGNGERRAAPVAPRSPLRLELAPSAATTRTPDDEPASFGAAARLGAALILLIGLLLQRTVLPLLPWGPADLMTVLVVVLALYAGPATGCMSGFAVGLLADALSDHALGRLAAVLCVVGYLSGLVPARFGHRLRFAWPIIGLGCVATPLLFALTGAFVGDTRAAGSLLITRCIAGLCYGLILAPVAYPVVVRLVSPRRRRFRRAV